MNRIIKLILRTGCTIFWISVSTFSLSAAEKWPSEVIGSDGKPVEKATFHMVYEERADRSHAWTWGVDQIDLADWEKGLRFDDENQNRQFQYLVIESPGCAPGVYQYAEPKVFTLEKEFWVEGKVIDVEGKPVPDAELTLGEFGLHTYTHILLDVMAGKLAWVQTKTDKDGKYRFKGATLNGFGFDVGVEVMARVMKKGKPMVGGSALSFVSESPLFEEARKRRYFEEGEKITVRPCDEITGVVVDAVTGKPIAGADIMADGIFYDPALDKKGGIMTDKDGRFSISKVRCETLAVEHPDYFSGNLIPEEGWREKKHHRLEIKLAPLVKTTLRFVDSHSGKAPLVPLAFAYAMETPAGEGWMFKMKTDGDCSPLISWEPLEIPADGVFVGKLPAGKCQIECLLPSRYSGEEECPYAKNHELNIPAAGDGTLKVELVRKPGVLLALNPVDRSVLNDPDKKWDSLSACMQVAPNVHYVDLDEPFYFQQVDAWNQKMKFTVELRKDGKDSILFEREFTATPDSWPVKVDAVAILGDLLK